MPLADPSFHLVLDRLAQPLRVLAIAVLRAETPGYDDDHAVGGHRPSGEEA